MSPDEIRRSWDDDDTPRSVFPEPLAERLTRENKELRAEIDEYDAILSRQGDLLTRTANALRGQPPELTSWSHHDVPELAQAVVDQMASVTEAIRPFEPTPGTVTVAQRVGILGRGKRVADEQHEHYARKATQTQARLDALVADLRGLADEWGDESRRYARYVAGSSIPEVLGAVAKALDGDATALRAVLDKHAGEQP